MSRVESSEDGGQFTVLARNDEETIGVVATLDSDATRADLLELVAEIDRELDVDATLLSASAETEQPVRDAVTDGGQA